MMTNLTFAGNNGGVGGSQDVGCVQYWLEAGIQTVGGWESFSLQLIMVD